MVYLIVRGLFRVGLMCCGFLHRTSEKGGKTAMGIRFLLCSPMLFGVSGMLAGVRWQNKRLLLNEIITVSASAS